MLLNELVRYLEQSGTGETKLDIVRRLQSDDATGMIDELGGLGLPAVTLQKSLDFLLQHKAAVEPPPAAKPAVKKKVAKKKPAAKKDD